jgi:two-component system, cell cycle response regulator
MTERNVPGGAPPRRDEPAFPQDAHRALPEAGRILIVDDEVAVRKIMSAQLARAGWTTAQAVGAEEAIRSAVSDPPALILMDVLMPGMNGYEATRRLKAEPRTARVPIILVTGLGGIDDKLAGLAAGADEFLSKPVNTAELTVRIANLVRLRRYEDQLKESAVIPTPTPEPEAVDASAGTGPSHILLVQRAAGPLDDVRAVLQQRAHTVSSVGAFPGGPLEQAAAGVDLVILDAALPSLDMATLCAGLRAKESTRHVPIVVITELDDPEERLGCLMLGVDDVLLSTVDQRELAARVDRLLKQKARLDLLQARYQAALIASNNDGLTGLFNHAYFKRYLELEVKRSQRHNHPTSLVLLDIDNFKAKNDTYGHAAGDQVLAELSRRLRTCIREIDVPARYGGEEFVIVLPYTDITGATVVAERVRATIAAESFPVGRPESLVPVTVSVGVAACPRDAQAAADLVQAADDSLYRAKREGKNRVRTASEMPRGA